MPALHRKFTNDVARLDGPTFEVGGEEFHCVPEAPGGLMATLASGIDYDARGNEVYHATNVNRFIEMVLLEEREVAKPVEPKRKAKPRTDDAMGEDDAEVVEDAAVVMVTEPTDDLQRWRVLMNDKKRPVPLGLLVDIVMWLSEYYTERPTEPSRR